MSRRFDTIEHPGAHTIERSRPVSALAQLLVEELLVDSHKSFATDPAAALAFATQAYEEATNSGVAEATPVLAVHAALMAAISCAYADPAAKEEWLVRAAMPGRVTPETPPFKL